VPVWSGQLLRRVQRLPLRLRADWCVPNSPPKGSWPPITFSRFRHAILDPSKLAHGPDEAGGWYTPSPGRDVGPPQGGTTAPQGKLALSPARRKNMPSWPSQLLLGSQNTRWSYLVTVQTCHLPSRKLTHDPDKPFWKGVDFFCIFFPQMFYFC